MEIGKGRDTWREWKKNRRKRRIKMRDRITLFYDVY